MSLIYILTNPSFSEYILMGCTDDLDKHLAQLNAKDILPLPFEVYAVYQTDSSLSESDFLSLLSQLCPKLAAMKVENKAFYSIAPEAAYVFLESIATLSGTNDKLIRISPEGTYPYHSNKSSKPRRKPFRFSDYDIPVGAEIVYIKDSDVVATVVDDRHISYNDVITSISALAKKLLGTDKPIQGTLFFSYQGTKLTELRKK